MQSQFNIRTHKLRSFFVHKNSILSRLTLELLVHFRNILVVTGLYGGKFVTGNHLGLRVLQLNRKSSLGSKGDLIHLPSDETICNYVRLRGSWELDDCLFLVQELIRHQTFESQSLETLFLDIGANSGLIARQVRNLLGQDISMILVEPIPKHVEAIRLNLEKFHLGANVSIVQGALSNVDGVSEIYIQESNRGNTSLLRQAMMQHKSEKLDVQLIDTLKFSGEYLSKFKHIVLKSDTQGFDAKILSQIPPKVWSSIKTAVIEIWALPEIEHDDIARLINTWRNLAKYRFYDSSKTGLELTLEEVQLIWGSKSGKSLNLRLTSLVGN